MENSLTLETIEKEWEKILAFLTIHNQEKGSVFFISSAELKVHDAQNETVLNFKA